MWLVHTETVAALYQDTPSLVRRYLTDMKDFAMLRVFDQQKMSDNHPDGGS